MPTLLERLVGALSPRYEVRRELGAGGMAVVFLAHDNRHDRPVAVKVLRPDLSHALGPERFLREIRLAAGLTHPHILPLHDSGEADGLLWYVMPFVEGEPLDRRLHREGRLPVADAVRIATAVAGALAYAHSRGIVHRDIKPANVLLTAGHPLVADFGIARAVGTSADTRLTETGIAIGTPAYMAPEQALADREIDGRTDVYALGCVLYEMLAGEPPFAAPTGPAMIARRLSEPPPRVHEVRPDVPLHVSDALVAALAASPTDRCPSAAAFVQALAGAASPPATPAPPTAETLFQRLVPLPPDARRRRMRRLTVAAAVLIVVAGAVGWARLGRSGARAPAGVPGAQAIGDDSVPTVAVLPFRAVGGEVEYWGEGMVDLLTASLAGVQPLRPVDPVTVLAAWRRLRAESPTAPELEVGLRAAAAVGARYAITGSAVQMGPTVRVVATAHDVSGDTTRGVVSASGGADSVLRIIDEVAVELLRAGLLPTDGSWAPPNLSRVTTRSLPALKAYLAGEREYRRTRWDSALPHYERAVELDSTFARATYRLARAKVWVHQVDAGAALHERAARLAAALPRRDALLIQGAAEESRDWTRLEQLTREYPQDVDGWVSLGDALFHYGGRAVRPISGYRLALEQAIRLHPGFGEAYQHLIEDAFLRQDSAAAASLIAAHERNVGGAQNCPQRLAFDLAWGNASSRRAAMTALDTVTTEGAAFGCVQAPLLAPDAALDRLARVHLAGAVGDPSPFLRTVSLWRLLQLYVPRGRMSDARRSLREVRRDPSTRALAARWVLMLELSGHPDSAATAAAAELLAGDPHPTARFWLAALAVENGRQSNALAFRASDTGRVRELVRDYGAALREYASLMRGDFGRLSAFEAALRRLPPASYTNEQPQQFLRYRVGRRLHEAGRLEDARRYFLSFQPYDYFYTSEADFHLSRIYAALGEADSAAVRRARAERWWRGADPDIAMRLASGSGAAAGGLTGR